MSLLFRSYKGSHQARWAVGSQVITSGANFATAVIIVRAVGFEEFGRFSICFILVMISRNFLNGALLLPMSTIAPKLRTSTAPAYRGFLTLNNAAFALGSSLLLLAGAVPLGVVLNAPWLPSLILSLAAANLTANGADFVRRYHFVNGTPVRAFWVDAARFNVQLAAMLLMAQLMPTMFSAETALYALAAGSASGWLFGMWSFGPMRWSTALARALWPRHWNFVKWMTPSAALEAVESSVPLLVGGALLGEGTLGLVRAMQGVANVLNLPFNAMQQIAPSAASAAYVKHGVQGLRRVLLTMTGWSTLIILTLSAVVVAFHEPLIAQVFQADPASGLPILLAYCALNLAIALRFPLTVAFQTIEKLQVVMVAHVMATLTVVTTMAAAIELLGAPAVPIISMLAVIVTGLVYGAYASLHRKARGRPDPSLHIRIFNAYLEVRSILAQSDLIYPAFVAMLSPIRPHQRPVLAGRSTEAVIEGFPRSANTYFASFFELAQGRPTRLARHLHDSYQIRYAERYQIPCVFLARAPVNAVASALMRDDRTRAPSLLRNYIRLYRAVLNVRKYAVIAPFEAVIRDPNAVILKLNDRYSTSFRTLPKTDHYLVHWEVEKKDRQALGTKNLNPKRLAMPSPEKTHNKATLSSNIRRDFSDLVDTAEALYERVLSLSDFDEQPTQSR